MTTKSLRKVGDIKLYKILSILVDDEWKILRKKENDESGPEDEIVAEKK